MPLRSRTDERRATEMDVAVQVLNRMLELGRPEFRPHRMSPERGRGHCARTHDPCTTAAYAPPAASRAGGTVGLLRDGRDLGPRGGAPGYLGAHLLLKLGGARRGGRDLGDADHGRKQVAGGEIRDGGIDSERPITEATGLLCGRNFHPQEWQLASRHRTPRARGPGGTIVSCCTARRSALACPALQLRRSVVDSRDEIKLKGSGQVTSLQAANQRSPVGQPPLQHCDGPYIQPSPCWPGTVARALTEPLRQRAGLPAARERQCSPSRRPGCALRSGVVLTLVASAWMALAVP